MIAHAFLLLLLATTTVRAPDGTEITAEIAATGEERATGLMRRTTLARNSGMLFVFPGESINQFWMKDTLIPLDMVWIDSQKRVIYVEKGAPPCPVIRRECPSYGPSAPALYVLELASGSADRLGIKPGATLAFQVPAGVKVTD